MGKTWSRPREGWGRVRHGENWEGWRRVRHGENWEGWGRVRHGENWELGEGKTWSYPPSNPPSSHHVLGEGKTW